MAGTNAMHAPGVKPKTKSKIAYSNEPSKKKGRGNDVARQGGQHNTLHSRRDVGGSGLSCYGIEKRRMGPSSPEGVSGEFFVK